MAACKPALIRLAWLPYDFPRFSPLSPERRSRICECVHCVGFKVLVNRHRLLAYRVRSCVTIGCVSTVGQSSRLFLNYSCLDTDLFGSLLSRYVYIFCSSPFLITATSEYLISNLILRRFLIECASLVRTFVRRYREARL